MGLWMCKLNTKTIIDNKSGNNNSEITLHYMHSQRVYCILELKAVKRAWKGRWGATQKNCANKGNHFLQYNVLFFIIQHISWFKKRLKRNFEMRKIEWKTIQKRKFIIPRNASRNEWFCCIFFYIFYTHIN